MLTLKLINEETERVIRGLEKKHFRHILFTAKILKQTLRPGRRIARTGGPDAFK